MTPSPQPPQEIPVLDGPTPARDGLIRIGTRGSRLAIAQTSDVARAVARASGADVALVIVKTHGDVTTAPLAQLGGTGVFVSALRDALAGGECDLAVHSLKDLPTAPCPGVALGAIPERADARDALIGRGGAPLDGLPRGARVGTGSPRRAAQLLARRPDLDVRELRGNIDTRMARVGVDLDAVVLAAAGLDRIGRAESISERFPLDAVPTAPGQGALAVEARESEVSGPVLASILARLDDPASRVTALSERALLAALEAGCAAPVGAWGRIDGSRIALTGAVYRPDGGAELEATLERDWRGAPSAGIDALARELGTAVAARLLADGAARLAPLGEAG